MLAVFHLQGTVGELDTAKQARSSRGETLAGMEGLPSSVKQGLEFERSNWTNGSVVDDPFYDAPHEALNAPPGTALRIDKDVDTSKYLIPPTTSLSRFVYQSETLGGSKVPASAYVLWPYSPRTQSDGYPVVAWAHGTSGFDANAAPSHHKNLWQHFLCPYQIAVQGYVVVATDYVGLGVHKYPSGHGLEGQTYPSGQPIIHEYLAPPSQANDIIHSVTAAQAAFPELSKSFVVIGHSQGGGAAWSVAQKAASTSIPGYLGAIAVSPYTGFLEEENEFYKLLIPAMLPGLASTFPDFSPKDILTAEGEKRLNIVYQTSAAMSSAVAILSGVDLLKPNWKTNTYFRKYQDLTSTGGKAIRGPLLVIHGKQDPILSIEVVENAVKRTAELFPSAQIEYASLPNVTHVSALVASQRLWMDWIGDRFAGRALESRCHSHELACARPHGSQQSDQNWYLEAATRPYHAPGP